MTDGGKKNTQTGEPAPGVLGPSQRATLAGLAALIAPAHSAMPGADELALSGAPTDAVLAARPDLLAPLSRLLEKLAGTAPEAALERIEAEQPGELTLLMQVVAGAYYLDRRVQAALAYNGQQALSLPRDGFGAEELVMEMMERPAMYRDAGSSDAGHGAGGGTRVEGDETWRD
ncbi:MAG: hypothetical protein GC150_16870 [Rhizobiales bacterium]|nr:hypothetical protein [Hyphomicrobiales bacterium]